MIETLEAPVFIKSDSAFSGVILKQEVWSKLSNNFLSDKKRVHKALYSSCTSLFLRNLSAISLTSVLGSKLNSLKRIFMPLIIMAGVSLSASNSFTNSSIVTANSLAA